MKKSIKKLVMCIALMAVSAQAHADGIWSHTGSLKPAVDAKVNAGRVAQVIPLVRKDDINASIVVEDLGGSQDVSPVQEVYFSIYTRGEIFSASAAYDLAGARKFKSAARVSGGIYQVVVSVYENGRTFDKTLTINAIDAITAMKNLKCSGDGDCTDVSNFAAAIQVTGNP